MSKMDYSHYKSYGNSEKIPSANVSRQHYKKTPQSNQSLRERSARPNQLPQILKDYKQFCDKYFNTNSNPNPNHQNGFSPTPSFLFPNSITPAPDTDTHTQTQSLTNVQLSFLENSDFCFFFKEDNQDELISRMTINADIKSIGFEKNNKSDYEQRRKRVLKQNEEKLDEDKYDEDFNYNDKLDVSNKKKDKTNSIGDNLNEHDKNIINDNSNDNKDKDNDKDQNANMNPNPIKIFDESTHNIINEEIRNHNARKIQIYYKIHTHHENRRDRIYFGYDKSKKHLLSIYMNKRKLLSSIEDEFHIYSLLFKIYSFDTKELKYELKDIKDLLNINSISNKQIDKNIPDLIEKVLQQDQEESEYDFDVNQKEKAIPDDIANGSLSSIGHCDYDNI